MIKEHTKHLLPNISKTGIDDVDENYKPKEEKKESDPLKMMMDMKLGKNNKKLGCMSFVKTEGFIPSYDLDQLYSMAIENFDRAEE